MSVPAVQRIVVGVDGSAESAAALRWACREAALRGAEVHAVYVREAHCHSLPSYAAPAQSSQSSCDDFSVEELASKVKAEFAADVEIKGEVADGLAARVLLERCAGADMLVLGTASDRPGASRPAGPVIRACLRRAACPVVVISAEREPAHHEKDAGAQVKVPAGV
jgi:nucleotide-binding universal stress UspA family protein